MSLKMQIVSLEKIFLIQHYYWLLPVKKKKCVRHCLHYTYLDLELSFSNPGLFEFQVWNKPGIEKLNSRSTLISPLTGEGGPPSQTKTMQNTVRWPWLFLYISLSSSSEFCNFLKLQLRSSNKIGFKHLKSRGPRSRWFEND